MTQHYYSHGKLLITAEYGVLDGALALAVPTTYGQSLTVEKGQQHSIAWQSIDEQGQPWFKATINTATLDLANTTDPGIGSTLVNIFKAAKNLNPAFLVDKQGFNIRTNLDFPRNWGLGTSSTLINNVAQWAAVNPYTLLKETFGGSGYDIACAQADNPIFYQLEAGEPKVNNTNFNPPFAAQLFFIYLNQKQNSRTAIANYRKHSFDQKSLSQKLTALTLNITKAKAITTFEDLITEHEQLLSTMLQTATVKERLFPDYFGALKSLGGWGGDFILATGNEKTPDYFKAKGFDIIVPYAEMVL